MPGWYGVGTAVEAYVADEAHLQRLQTMYQQWPFFHNLIDSVERAMSKADMGIAQLYTELVADETIRHRFSQQILTEYQRTITWVLQITGQKALLDQKPFLQHAIRMRNPYIDPLHFIQISLLKRLRSAQNNREIDHLREVIFLTVNGIAAGLKNSG
jgi:phosphoenolpyruvate carboxylase